MSYIRNTWYNGYAGGTPITAEKLNNIETGITDAASNADLANTHIASWLPQRGVYVGAVGTNTDLVAGKMVVDNVTYPAAPKTSVYQGSYYTTLSDNRGPYWNTITYSGTPSTTTTMLNWAAGTFSFPWVAYVKVLGAHRATGGANASVAYLLTDGSSNNFLTAPNYLGTSNYALYQAPGTGTEAGWLRAVDFVGKLTGTAGSALNFNVQISCTQAVEFRGNCELVVCPYPQG